MFFNGNYWNARYGEKIDGVSATVLEETDMRTLRTYKNARETVVYFMSNKNKNTVELKRISAALDFLQDNRNEEAI